MIAYKNDIVVDEHPDSEGFDIFRVDEQMENTDGVACFIDRGGIWHPISCCRHASMSERDYYKSVEDKYGDLTSIYYSKKEVKNESR